MEHIHDFFNQMLSHIEDENNYYQDDFQKYPTVGNLNLDLLSTYKNRVGNKLLTLDKDTRIIYANLILESIDTYNIQNKILTNSSDYNEKEVILYNGANGTEVDITSVSEYCSIFISLIWETFKSFGIDLRDIIKEKGGKLKGNYNFMFADVSYTHLWEKIIDSNKQKHKSTDSFTAPRQLLAIKTILEELGKVRIIKNGKDKDDVNFTKLVKFLQFITGREKDSKPGDTTFYKYLTKSEHEERSTYDADCSFVAEQLEMVGLGKLANKLRNGIKETNQNI